MAMFRRLFGRRGVGSADDAREALSEVESLTPSEPRRAAMLLRRTGVRHHATMGIGRELHARFRDAHVALHGAIAALSEAVAVTSYAALGDDASVADVLAFAAATDAGVLLVRSDDRRSAGGAGGELEALAALDGDASLAMVVVGDADILLRGSFARSLRPDASVLAAVEVPQELVDLAEAQGLTARFVPG